MQTILVSILMLFPAIIAVLLIVGGIVMASVWAFSWLPSALTGKTSARAQKLHRENRRSGQDRRHGLPEHSGQQPTVAV